MRLDHAVQPAHSLWPPFFQVRPTVKAETSQTPGPLPTFLAFHESSSMLACTVIGEVLISLQQLMKIRFHPLSNQHGFDGV